VACGASKQPRSRTSVTLPTLGPAAAAGEVVFAHSCSACHSLIGNESLRKQGGDLLNYKLTQAQLISFTRVMPARLTATQLEAVVRYIMRAQAKAG
jgi:mono/diheme cytochrome c family protein